MSTSAPDNGAKRRSAPSFLLGRVPRSRLMVLLACMALSSLTEGIGLILLVPVIGAVGGGESPAIVRTIVMQSGLPPTAGPLLTTFVAIVVVRGALQYTKTVVGRRLAHDLVDGLRLQCMALLLGARWQRLSAMRQSDNASLLISNIDRVDAALNYLFAAAAAGVTLAGAAGVALLLSPRLAVAGGCAGLLTIVAYRGLRRRAVETGHLLGTAYEEVHARTAENLQGLRLIKSLGAERRAADALRDTFAGMRAAEMGYVRTAAGGQVVLQIVAAAVLALASWFAIERMKTPATELVPLVALCARALPLLGVLQESWQGWLHGAPAVVETARLIEDLQGQQEPPVLGASKAPVLARAVELKRVTIRHPGRDALALDHVSIDLPACTTTALVGPSGAGKSTLADVVGGLLAPDGGELRIDDVRIEGELLRAWRGAVAYVQQEPLLFHATVRENLLWAAPEANNAALAAALADASAGFVHALPHGLDTVVGDRGSRLSGGERQRLSLARALLRRPQLLILDEPTSALDAENERAIAGALQRLRGRMTILLIAHRGALADVADRTVTLENGRVTAIKERSGADRAVS